MAERLVRMGKVSSVDYENGMVSVTYPDLDDSTTDLFPLFSMAYFSLSAKVPFAIHIPPEVQFLNKFEISSTLK